MHKKCVAVSLNGLALFGSAAALWSCKANMAAIVKHGSGLGEVALVSLTPDSGVVNAIPKELVATFNSPVKPLPPTAFVLGGTCRSLPKVLTVAMDATGTAATASLGGGSCNDGTELSVKLNLADAVSVGGRALGAAQVNTSYLVNPAALTAVIGAPSPSLVNAATSTQLLVSYQGFGATEAVATSTLTATGGGLSVKKLSGDPDCQVAVKSVSGRGATVALSECVGDGALAVQVHAGTVKSSMGIASLASAASGTITVDNTGPTVVKMVPAAAPVASVPSSVTVVFSEAVQAVDASAFVVSGTCASLPGKGLVTLSTDQKAVTLPLSYGQCLNGQSVQVQLNPGAVHDLAGNLGSGPVVSNAYVITSSGPAATLGSPLQTVHSINVAGSISIPLSYSLAEGGTASLTGVLTAAGGGVTLTTLSGAPSCSAAVSALTGAGATITVHDCSGDGTLSVHVNAGTAIDAFGHLSPVSNESSVITIDNTPPVLLSSQPANGATASSVSSFLLLFSEPISHITVDASGGNCTVPSSVQSTSGLGTSAITLTLTNTCAEGQMVILTPQQVLDVAGNQISASATVSATYVPNKIIYVTAPNVTGAMGGVTGADSICNTDMNKPTGGGVYKALLVDDLATRVACVSSGCSGGGASEHVDWVLLPNRRYVQTNKTTSIGVTDAHGLFTFPLTHVFLASLIDYWSGLNADWTTATGLTLNSWTTAGGSSGRLGSVDTTSSGAIAVGTDDGSVAYSLLCVEQ